MISKNSAAVKALRHGTALPALALLTAGITVGAFSAAPAFAQDYTSGAVSGTVIDTAKHPIANAEVELRSQSQGQARTFKTSPSGAFSAAGLAPGVYDVSIHAEGYQDLADTITVVAAQENRLTLTVSGADAPKDIVVTGTRVRQDFTKSTTGLNIDVPSTAAQIALPRSVTALTLLAPGTSKGVMGFGDVSGIGGSSVAENAYYINGLNITNPDTYVGSARVPFDFYKTVDVQTGGYAAEFGRATGGVINATTKSGTNTPMMAIHGNFEPSFAQSTGPNTGGNNATIGNLSRNDDHQLTVEAGGALLKDHVFLYGLYTANRHITKEGYSLLGKYERTQDTSPFFGGKADIYLNPTQHFEFTYFNTQAKEYVDDFAFTPNAQNTGGVIGAPTGNLINKTGGTNWVGRYTGNVTDFFQVSAAYGISKDTSDQLPSDPSAYYVRDSRSSTSPTGSTATRVISQGQPFQSNQVDETRRRFYRVDGDLRFDLLGRHHVRFGLDNEDLSETKTLMINGGLPIRYTFTDSGVQLLYERLGGHVSGQDRAYYLQDSWEPAAGLTINAGVRDDEFRQSNLSGQQYLNFKGNIGLRGGFSYIPNGSSPFKFTGSYGRYFIPPAMNLGFRGKDLYFAEYFDYPIGTTPATFRTDAVTGLPLLNLGAAQTTRSGAGYSSACPTDISSAPGHPVNGTATCLILGAGIQDPAAAKVISGTKATYEDEVILGARYQVTSLFSVGLTGTYRKLSRVSEDTDFAPIISSALGCGTAGQTGSATTCNFYNGGNTAYYIWNPGASSVTVRDWTDASKTYTLTGLTFPQPTRTYQALTLDWKRVDDGKWSFNGSVTWSRLKGNTEGTVKSDAGNGAQSDAGSTQDFDYLGLTDYSYGLLPNDHTWSIKAFGAYHVTPNLLFGANILVQSPMHGSCEGIHPTDSNAAAYGPSSYYCGTGALTTYVYKGSPYQAYPTSAPSPRGTGLQTDWLKQIDLSARYTLPASLGFGDKFVLRVDAFNVFNSHAILQRDVQHETDAGPAGGFIPDPLYGSPLFYQTPRSFRFGFDFAF